MTMRSKKHVFPRTTEAGVKVLAVTLCVTAFAAASEKKIARSALPPAVEKTVRAQTEGATIKGFTMETENGKTVYEVEMTLNGQGRDVAMAADGTVLEVEQEIALDNVPDAARNALKTRAGSAKIVSVESVTKDGKIVSYEADTLKGTKKAEIAAGPNGEKVEDAD